MRIVLTASVSASLLLLSSSPSPTAAAAASAAAFAPPPSLPSRKRPTSASSSSASSSAPSRTRTTAAAAAAAASSSSPAEGSDRGGGGGGGRGGGGAGAAGAGAGAAADEQYAHLYVRKPRPPYIPGVIPDPDYVRIFDTTLRDGEQSPGATLTSSEKLEIARNLAKLGVDVIEAGFPVASPDDFNAVRRIADEVGNEVFEEDGYVPVICGLSRANERDVRAAWDAVKGAARPRVHTFIATSPIHMETKLSKTPDEVVDIAVRAVSFARSLGCDDVEFSPEDAGRSDPEFLYRILGEVIKAGATTLNIPDTTGWNMPWEFGDLIGRLRANVPGAEGVVFSTHCQNDLGLATANSLAGAKNGARQLECTVNGIGERAGNASLEEVVMALALKGASHFEGSQGTGRLYTAINPVHITPTSKLVSEYTGMKCQPHKAVVGANAFQHESGIHQDGMIKNKLTYEIMTPESVGLMRGDAQSGAGIVLGKHSGRNAVGTRLKELGYDIDGERLNKVFARFKEVAEKKKGGLEDEDLEALVVDQSGSVNTLWEVSGLQVSTGMSGIPTATVKLVGPDGVERYTAATGTGPVDAVYKAIDAIMGVYVDLQTYSLESVSEGIEALATTRVTIAPKAGGPNDSAFMNVQTGTVMEKRFSGAGSDTDIVVASARAYTSALNKLLMWNLRRRKSMSSMNGEDEEAGGGGNSKASGGTIGDAIPVADQDIIVVQPSVA